MCYQQYCKRLECNINNDVKVFWNFVNRNARSSTIPTEIKYGNDSANSDEHIANLFAGYFESVYKTSVASYPSAVQCGFVDVNSISIKIREVLDKINSLNINKGPGEDGIPSVFMRYHINLHHGQKVCNVVLLRI